MEKQMKRKFVQIAALCLAAALFLSSGGGTASAAPASSSDRIVRVGLHHDGPYGTGSVEGLNFQNEVGSGFRFGYYDSASRFVELGTTVQTAISVVETMNVCYGIYNGYSSYHTAITTNVAVGEYHLELPGTYASFDQAQGLASQHPGGFAAYIGGTYRARVGNYTTRGGAETAQSALAAQGVSTTIVGTSAYGVSVVATGTNNILFQYDDLGQGTGLGVEPVQSSAEKCTTWSKSKLYNGGFRFERINGGKMTVVNLVSFEEYIEGVTATEMSNSWPVEALKAQALAARSYFVTLGTSTHSAGHFDICDNPHCQAYDGQTNAGSNTRAAVEQTAGLGVFYNGKPAQSFYYSSNGGASESVSNVWGSNQSLYPYLVGKADPYEPTLNLKNTWERSFTSAQIISRVLAGKNVSAPIVSAKITAYTDVGNPKLITFTDSAGNNFSVSGRTVYGNLGLPSFRFGLAGSEGTSPTTPAAPSASVSINGAATVNGTAGLYTIDGNGSIAALGGDVYVITDSGTSLLGQGADQSQSTGNSWSSFMTAVNGTITFAGRGWGHNIGLSQFGAKAMAEQGYTYQQILQFYYTGVTVGYV